MGNVPDPNRRLVLAAAAAGALGLPSSAGAGNEASAQSATTQGANAIRPLHVNVPAFWEQQWRTSGIQSVLV